MKYLRFCPACSNRCTLSAWAKMMSKKKRGVFSRLAAKIKSGLKLTKQLLRH